VWGRTGKELFFRNTSGDMVAVDVQVTPEVQLGEERVLFPTPGFMSSQYHAMYDVTPDDQRFVMIRGSRGRSYSLVVVTNFVEEMKARVPR
jgi:hypothetical protein